MPNGGCCSKRTGRSSFARGAHSREQTCALPPPQIHFEAKVTPWLWQIQPASSVWVAAAPWKALQLSRSMWLRGLLVCFLPKCLWDNFVCVRSRAHVCVCLCCSVHPLCCVSVSSACEWELTCLCTQASKSHTCILEHLVPPQFSSAHKQTWGPHLKNTNTTSLCVAQCVAVCLRKEKEGNWLVWSEKWEHLGREWNILAWNFYRKLKIPHLYWFVAIVSAVAGTGVQRESAELRWSVASRRKHSNRRLCLDPALKIFSIVLNTLI